MDGLEEIIEREYLDVNLGLTMTVFGDAYLIPEHTPVTLTIDHNEHIHFYRLKYYNEIYYFQKTMDIDLSEVYKK